MAFQSAYKYLFLLLINTNTKAVPAKILDFLSKSLGRISNYQNIKFIRKQVGFKTFNARDVKQNAFYTCSYVSIFDFKNSFWYVKNFLFFDSFIHIHVIYKIGQSKLFTGGCLCDNCTPSFLPLLIFDWCAFSRRVTAR